MSSSGLPLGLSVPRGSNSPERKPDTQRQVSSSRPKQGDSPSKTEPENEEDTDSGLSRSKPALTEQQKRSNHIESEKRRRERIREQYDKLATLTPGMDGQGRSEGRVLEEAAKYAASLKEERAELIKQIEAKGGVVDPELKKAIESRR